jgi:hypothetical protein
MRYWEEINQSIEEEIRQEAISRGHDPDVYLYLVKKLAEKIKESENNDE